MEIKRRHIICLSLIVIFFFAAVTASTDHHPHHHKKDSKHFVLVHGSCLGAWSWYKLVPLLKASGHTVTAIDLAASGINPLQVNDLQTFSDYSKPLLDYMASLSSHERVILVGHSSGGAVISQAMEHFPEKVSVGIFLTAAMPSPSLPYSLIAHKAINKAASSLDNKFTYDNGPNNPPTTFIFGPKFISEVVFQYSPTEDAALGTLMVRPRRLVSLGDLVLSEAKYGSVSRVYIISEKDQVLTEEFQKWMIEKNPPRKVFKISNSDHMAMLSQPTQLYTHLLNIAHDYS